MITRKEIVLGRLAVDAELVTPEQVQACIATQETELPIRPLGVHLVERGFLSDDELLTLLDIQAEYIEELSLAHWEGMPPGALPAPGRPVVSADGLVEVRRLRPEDLADAPPQVQAAVTRTQQRLLNLKKARVFTNLRAAMTGVLEKVVAGIVVGIAAVTILFIAMLIKDRVLNAGAGPEPTPEARRPGGVRVGLRPPGPAAPAVPKAGTPRSVPARTTTRPNPAVPAGTPSATGTPAGTGTDRAGIEGLVLGADHQPLVSLLVTATGFEGEGAGNLTDARGYYRIDGLLPGSYLVSLNSVQNQEKPGYSAFEDRIITVKKGELASVNFGVDAGTRIFGAVLADGQRIAGALVTLISLSGLSSGGNDVGGLSTKNATSNEAGEYALSGVLPGPYTLIVAHPEDPARIARVNLEVPATAELRRDLLFTNLGIRGKVVDRTTGEPLQGVALSARRRESGAPNRLLDTMVSTEMTSLFSDENGAFAFSSLEPGSYTLVATLDGYASAAVPAVVMPEGGPASVTVPMRIGGGLFEGVVRRAGGQPVPDAFVAIQDAQGNDLVLKRVNADGRFESGHLEPGTYQVVLYLGGAQVDKLSVTLEQDVITKQEFVVE